MTFKNFDRKSEYESYKEFLESLKKKVNILYISNIKMFNRIPKNRTGVYISETHDTITVFYEVDKKSSFKTA